MSIEWTTSANSTVTCLYSADRLTCVTGAPHSLQNLEFGGSSVPHDPQNSPVAVSPPPPSPPGSTSVIVSPLVSDVCQIAVPAPIRSFETLKCRRFRDWRIEGFCGLSRDGVHPDREKTGRTLREALENIDATE